jgi:hypothetical protein
MSSLERTIVAPPRVDCDCYECGVLIDAKQDAVIGVVSKRTWCRQSCFDLHNRRFIEKSNAKAKSG